MDIKRSDLPLLISLDVLLTELNVTRAAERLGISQSAMSGHLARLRRQFDDPLLVPSENGRGMAPTERALVLRPRLAEALAQLRDAVATEPLFDPSASRRTFTVAANDNVFAILGLDVMAEVMAQHNPQLRMGVVPSADDQLVERMARGEVDLFLGDVGKVPPTLKVRFLMSDHFLLAQRRGHPRGLQPPTLDEYCSLQHVIVSPRADFRGPVDELLEGLSRTRRVVATVPSYNQAVLALSQTDGVSTLPHRLLQRHAGLVDPLPLPFEVPPFQIAMAWHPRAQGDPALAWLRQRFVEATRRSAAG